MAVSETLRRPGGPGGRGGDDDEDESDTEEEHGEDDDDSDEEQGWAETIEHIVDPLVEPIKPLKLLLPRKENGVWHWRLFIVTLSMLANSCGVSVN
jgi:TATA-binding protein-associated factor Taf7